MDNYKLTVGLEPTDKYEKAKQDLIVALSSFLELNLTERENLIKELFGTEAFIALCQMMQKYFG